MPTPVPFCKVTVKIESDVDHKYELVPGTCKGLPTAGGRKTGKPYVGTTTDIVLPNESYKAVRCDVYSLTGCAGSVIFRARVGNDALNESDRKRSRGMRCW
jgi:hypothetical protein